MSNRLLDKAAALRLRSKICNSLSGAHACRDRERAAYIATETTARFNTWLESMKVRFAREAAEDFDRARPAPTFATYVDAELKRTIPDDALRAREVAALCAEFAQTELGRQEQERLEKEKDK